MRLNIIRRGRSGARCVQRSLTFWLLDAAYGLNCSLNARLVLAANPDHRGMSCGEFAFDEVCDRFTNVRTVALHAVGHPSDIWSKQQR